jgi:hypothetical protein
MILLAKKNWTKLDEMFVSYWTSIKMVLDVCFLPDLLLHCYIMK